MDKNPLQITWVWAGVLFKHGD